MNDGRFRRAEMVGRHHLAQRVLERALRIGEEGGDPRQRLFLFGIEDMQDGADQQRVAGLFPMVAPLQRAFGVDQNVGDVLHVADFVRALADFEQRIVAGRRASVGLNSRQCENFARQPAVSCQFSPLMS